MFGSLEDEVKLEQSGKKVLTTVIITVIRVLALVAGGALLVFGAHKAIHEISEYHAGRKIYSHVVDKHIKLLPADALKKKRAEEAEIKTYYPPLEIDMIELWKTNPHFIGWLYYEDAEVNYPVVSAPAHDPEKYLTTAFTGEKNSAGCLFAEPGETGDFAKVNNFIYGHNMRNNTMFGKIKVLFRHPQRIKDKYFYFYSIDGHVRTYEIFAILKTTSDSDRYKVPAGSDVVKYINESIRMSVYKNEEIKDMTVPHIMTLSTCYGETGSGQRILVQGYEIRREKYMYEPEKE